MKLALVACWLVTIPILCADAPAVKKAVAPGRYPPLARIAKVTGKVEVSVIVGADGKVSSIVSSKSSDGKRNLIANAEFFAKRWEFSGPSDVPISITFEYGLIANNPSEATGNQESPIGTEFIPPRTVVITGVMPPDTPTSYNY